MPLYSKSKLDKVAVKERYKGFHEGRAGELRRQTHQRQRQKEQALPEPATKWFSVPVDAHVNADGVRIDAHSRPVKIVQP